MFHCGTYVQNKFISKWCILQLKNLCQAHRNIAVSAVFPILVNMCFRDTIFLTLRNFFYLSAYNLLSMLLLRFPIYRTLSVCRRLVTLERKHPVRVCLHSHSPCAHCGYRAAAMQQCLLFTATVLIIMTTWAKFMLGHVVFYNAFLFPLE